VPVGYRAAALAILARLNSPTARASLPIRADTHKPHIEVNNMNETDPATSPGDCIAPVGRFRAELTWSRRSGWRLRVVDPLLPGNGVCGTWPINYLPPDEQAAHVHAMASLEDHGWAVAHAFEEREPGRTWTVPVTLKEPRQ
jgi:hypothetical protein